MRKEVHRDALLLLAAVISLLAALILPLSYAIALTPEEETLLSHYEQGDIIRLHVVANSDSKEDQALKYRVRDAVIEAFGTLMTGAEDGDGMFALLKERKTDIEQLALQTARSLGFNGMVSAEVGVMRLPAKTYGKVTLPEGEYRALRITLGEGQGQNWWCVLFPQLCLALSDDGTVSPDLHWESGRIFSHWLAFAP